MEEMSMLEVEQVSGGMMSIAGGWLFGQAADALVSYVGRLYSEGGAPNYSSYDAMGNYSGF